MIKISYDLESDYALYAWLDTNLWSGAERRWQNAEHDQRWQVVQRILTYFECVDRDELNDFVWFNCDDIFFPNEFGNDKDKEIGQ